MHMHGCSEKIKNTNALCGCCLFHRLAAAKKRLFIVPEKAFPIFLRDETHYGFPFYLHLFMATRMWL